MKCIFKAACRWQVIQRHYVKETICDQYENVMECVTIQLCFAPRNIVEQPGKSRNVHQSVLKVCTQLSDYLRIARLVCVVLIEPAAKPRDSLVTGYIFNTEPRL